MTSESSNLEFDQFKAALDEVIQRHTPIKKRYVRANQTPFMNKMINKEITKRSCLRNNFLSSIRNEKKNFFRIINTIAIPDNKPS